MVGKGIFPVPRQGYDDCPFKLCMVSLLQRTKVKWRAFLILLSSGIKVVGWEHFRVDCFDFFEVMLQSEPRGTEDSPSLISLCFYSGGKSANFVNF